MLKLKSCLCGYSLQVPTEDEHLVQSLIKCGAVDLSSKSSQTLALMWCGDVSAVYSGSLKRGHMMTQRLLHLLCWCHMKIPLLLHHS